MTDSHTPAPWTLFWLTTHTLQRELGPCFLICDQKGNELAVVPVLLSEDTRNALLMATAPELLAVLMEALENPSAPGWQEKARAAIAKATNRSREA